MKIFALLLILLSASAFATSELHLQCQATHDSEVILDTEVRLAPQQRNLSIGGNHQFEFILSHNDGNEVELQAYDSFAPARSYATTSMNSAGDHVQLSIWKREFLMEARCTRL